MRFPSIVRLPLLVALLGSLVSCQKSPPPPADDAGQADVQLDTAAQRLSYQRAHELGQRLTTENVGEVDWAALRAGVEDGMAGTPSKVSPEQLSASLTALVKQARITSEKDLMLAGQTYLAENKARPEVTTTNSGLQYEVLKSGTGPSPVASDRVVVHYHGSLVDGTVFDSSVDRGEPITLGVSQVIMGWQEALKLMKTGDKWRLSIPPGIGYGPRRAGKIPPNSVLIFEVELLSIKEGGRK